MIKRNELPLKHPLLKVKQSIRIEKKRSPTSCSKVLRRQAPQVPYRLQDPFPLPCPNFWQLQIFMQLPKRLPRQSPPGSSLVPKPSSSFRVLYLLPENSFTRASADNTKTRWKLHASRTLISHKLFRLERPYSLPFSCFRVCKQTRIPVFDGKRVRPRVDLTKVECLSKNRRATGERNEFNFDRKDRGKKTIVVWVQELFGGSRNNFEKSKLDLEDWLTSGWRS